MELLWCRIFFFLAISSMTQSCSSLQKTLVCKFCLGHLFSSSRSLKDVFLSFIYLPSPQLQQWWFTASAFYGAHFCGVIFHLSFYLFCLVPCPGLTFIFSMCKMWTRSQWKQYGHNNVKQVTLNNKWSSNKFPGVVFKMIWWKIRMTSCAVF